jgi:very-short-patch-repair endonuclease
MKRNKPELKNIRSKLRQNMSLPEIILWQNLRRKQIKIRFRRQYSIGRYILDFYAPEIKLGIEIDGESHFFDKKSKMEDATRDQILSKEGIKILRYLNSDVTTNLKGVLANIQKEVERRTTPS